MIVVIFQHLFFVSYICKKVQASTEKYWPEHYYCVLKIPMKWG